jgi:multidrug efflux pump
MWISDVSVRRPVLASVISMLLVVFGLLSFRNLPLRELPDVDPPVVSIETVYVGAAAPVVESRITKVIEERVAGIEGIRTISSTSQDGRSQITIEFDLERDIEDAANDVRDRIGRVAEDLPEEAEPPEVFKVDADENVIMWFNLSSSALDALELSDYAERFLVDRLSVIDGVARVVIAGERRYAMRIWLDRVALAARDLTVADVEAALRAENVELPAGRLESRARDLTVRLERGYQTAADFERLVVARGEDGHLIRLGEVARVEVGPEEWRSEFRGNGELQVGLGIVKQSTANTLDVSRAAHAEIERIRPSLPPGTVLHDSYDSAVFIQAAIGEVYVTLAIAMGLVIGVIYVFLGTARAALVPALTVPISLVATFTSLLSFGLSINLLTLLALVLSIGIVVDDSIVVLENIQRRIEAGESRRVAALRGTREVGFAVLATTAVLVAVFVPIVFLEGTTGRLFRELAVTVSSAVAFSGVVALSLSAMLCSRLLRQRAAERPLAQRVRVAMDALSGAYARGLDAALRHPGRIAAGLVAVVLAIALLFGAIPSELEPLEDRGVLMVSMRGPEGSSFDYSVRHMRQLEQVMFPLLESGDARRVLTRVPNAFASGSAMNSGFSIIVLSDWDERERSSQEIKEGLIAGFAGVPGVQAFPILPGGLGRTGGGRPVQFVIGGSSYEEIAQWQDAVLERARATPGLQAPDGDFKPTRPQLRVEIDANRAADLGVPVETIGRTLETVLGSRAVTTFIRRGEEYDVILQGQDEQRDEPADLTNLYVRSARTAELIPLANLVSLRNVADAGELRRFNRMRAATLEANLAPGYTLGEGLAALERIAREVLPAHAVIDYKGASREFRESSTAAYFTFGMALLIVYLVLAAQFESFVHPFVILLTVPLAVAGGLYGLWVSHSTLNIYSQIAMTILVGIAAKNGILIVEFANQLRAAGLELDAAIRQASLVRLRPILMTGLSTTMGVVPLMLTSGAGAASREAIGVVIFSGGLFATALTLFVVPVCYRLLARGARLPSAAPEEAVAQAVTT